MLRAQNADPGSRKAFSVNFKLPNRKDVFKATMRIIEGEEYRMQDTRYRQRLREDYLHVLRGYGFDMMQVVVAGFSLRTFCLEIIRQDTTWFSGRGIPLIYFS